MNKLVHIAIGVAAGTGIGFGVGATLGAMGDGMAGEKTRAGDIEAGIQDYKARLTEFESYDGTLIRYGEACLSVLGNYAPEGPLSNVSQDVAVADLLANPDHPCGDDATQVRIATQDFLGVKTTLHDLQARDINEDYQKIESINENNRIDDEYRLWLYTGAIGALLCGLIGGGVGIGMHEFKEENAVRQQRPRRSL